MMTSAFVNVLIGMLIFIDEVVNCDFFVRLFRIH